jgi:hypothetical protein
MAENADGPNESFEAITWLTSTMESHMEEDLHEIS